MIAYVYAPLALSPNGVCWWRNLHYINDRVGQSDFPPVHAIQGSSNVVIVVNMLVKESGSDF